MARGGVVEEKRIPAKKAPSAWHLAQRFAELISGGAGLGDVRFAAEGQREQPVSSCVGMESEGKAEQ